MINPIRSSPSSYVPQAVDRVDRAGQQVVNAVNNVGNATQTSNAGVVKDIVQLSASMTAMQASLRMADSANQAVGVMLSKYRAELS